MGKYRKKPVVIEAVRFLGANFHEIRDFCGVREGTDSNPPHQIEIFNPIGTYSGSDDSKVTAEVWDKLHSTWVGVKDGQWIIRGIQGEFYPCDAQVFEDSYEAVE